MGDRPEPRGPAGVLACPDCDLLQILPELPHGILVALIKIAELAKVEAGIGMYGVGALMLLFPAIQVSLDPREIWDRLEWSDGEPPPDSKTPALGSRP